MGYVQCGQVHKVLERVWDDAQKIVLLEISELEY